MFTIIGGDGKEYGPVAAAQVQRWLVEGRANLDTQVRRVGEEQWHRLGDFAEFSAGAPPVLATVAPAAAPAGPVLASRLMRLVAAFIDWMLSCIVSLPGGIMLGLAVMAQGAKAFNEIAFASLAGAVGVMLLGQFLLAIPQCWLLATRGQSIGKLLLNLRIVRYQDEAPAGFVRAALLRGFVPWLIQLVPWMGLLFWLVDVCFIFGPEKRCLHDLIADTKVINVEPAA